MSILDTPRYSFNGIFYTNPCTANNDDVLPEVVVRDTSTLGPSILGHGDDDQMRDYLKTFEQRANYGEPNCHLFINGGWNPYGNHWCNFMNAPIASGVTSVSGAGPVVTPSDDPILGMQVKMLGTKSTTGIPQGDPVMVDADSTGLVTTQIFLGGIQIGDPNNGGVAIYYDTQCYQTWLNFNATVSDQPYGGEQNWTGIGTMMQFVIPAYIIPAPTPDMPPSLRQLLTLARQSLGGLVVRFQIFEMEPGYSDTYLQGFFDKGQRLANIAYGYLLGTIGVYNFNEPYYEPEGRKIEMYYPRPEMTWAAPDGTASASVPAAPKPWMGPPALFGNVVCVVKPGVVSIDLSSTCAKYQWRNPNGPQGGNPPTGFDVPMKRADLGDLQLCYWPAAGGNPVVIGTIDYGFDDYDRFRQYGGIQDLTYDPGLYNDIQNGTLFIRGNPASTRPNAGLTVLQETVVRLMVEPRVSYVGVPGDSGLVGFRLRYRGGEPPLNFLTTVYIFEYMNIIEVDTNAPCGNTNRPNQSTAQRVPGIFKFPSQITIAHQTGYTSPVYIQARAVSPGVSMIAFQLTNEVMGSSVPAWTTYDYATLRVYTNDDYSAQIKAGLTWEFVYQEVLQFYYVLFPAMTQFVKLNDRCAVYAARNTIREIVRKSDEMVQFRRTWNMPITRTMSPGKIDLLRAWLDQEERDPNCPCKNST